MKRKQVKKVKKRKNADLIGIDVFRNGMRQRVGKRNDYTLTQVSSKTFRITIR